MFNSDEDSSAFKKMHRFSTVDGFVEITEDMAEMIKYVANEPSVGLYYVQQHTKNAVPNLINLKNNVEEKCRGMSLHTEDLEDSMTAVRSMKECGLVIADEMVRDIQESLSILSTKRPKKGVIHSNSSKKGYERGSGIWGRGSVLVQADSGSGGGGYLSTVLQSAKERASILKWPNGGKIIDVSPSVNNNEGSTSSLKIVDDELPDSSQEEGKLLMEKSESVSPSFDEYKADKEAKLEEWLGGKHVHLQSQEDFVL